MKVRMASGEEMELAAAQAATYDNGEPKLLANGQSPWGLGLEDIDPENVVEQ